MKKWVIVLLLILPLLAYAQDRKIYERDLSREVKDMMADSAASILQDSIAFPVDTTALKLLNMDEGRWASMRGLDGSSNPDKGGGWFSVVDSSDYGSILTIATKSAEWFEHPTIDRVWIRDIYKIRRVGFLEDFGAVGDGSVNDSNAVIDAIESGIPLTVVSGKIYNLGNGISFDSCDVNISGSGGTKPIFQFTGSVGITLNQPNTFYTTLADTLYPNEDNQGKIILDSLASSFSIGDVMKIETDEDWYLSSSFNKGEIHVIQKILGDTIWVEGNIRDTYDPSKNVYIYRYKPVKVDIKGIDIQPATASNVTGISISYTKHSKIINVDVTNCGNQGIYLFNNIDPLISGCTISNSNRNTNGYGVWSGGNHGIKIVNCTFHGNVTAIDFSAAGGDIPSRDGQIIGNKIDGGGFDDSGDRFQDVSLVGAGISGHPACENVYISNNLISNTRVGIKIRGYNWSVLDNIFSGKTVLCIDVVEGENHSIIDNQYDLFLAGRDSLNNYDMEYFANRPSSFIKLQSTIDPTSNGYFYIIDNRADHLKRYFCEIAYIDTIWNYHMVGNHCSIYKSDGSSGVIMNVGGRKFHNAIILDNTVRVHGGGVESFWDSEPSWSGFKKLHYWLKDRYYVMRDTIKADAIEIGNSFMAMDETKFKAKISSTGSRYTVAIIDSFDFTGNDTIAATVSIDFSWNGKISGGDGDTLWFQDSDQIIGGDHHIFDGLHVIFINPSKSIAKANWFGWDGDSSTSDNTVLRRMLGTQARYLEVQSGDGKVSSSIQMLANQNLTGMGKDVTNIYCDAGNQAVFRFTDHSTIRDISLYQMHKENTVLYLNGRPIIVDNIRVENLADSSIAQAMVTGTSSTTYMYNSTLINTKSFSGASSCYKFQSSDTLYCYNSIWKGADYVYGGAQNGYAEFYATNTEQTNSTSGATFNQYNNSYVRVYGGTHRCKSTFITHDDGGNQNPIYTALYGPMEIIAEDWLMLTNTHTFPDTLIMKNITINIDTSDAQGRCGIRVTDTYLDLNFVSFNYKGKNANNSDVFAISAAGGSEEMKMKNVWFYNSGFLNGSSATAKYQFDECYWNIQDSLRKCLDLYEFTTDSYFRQCDFISEATGTITNGMVLIRGTCDSVVTFDKCNFIFKNTGGNAIEMYQDVTFNHCKFDVGRSLVSMSTVNSPIDIWMNNCIIRNTGTYQIQGGGGGATNRWHMNNNTLNGWTTSGLTVVADSLQGSNSIDTLLILGN